jgi:hypothetical protein
LVQAGDPIYTRQRRIDQESPIVRGAFIHPSRANIGARAGYAGGEVQGGAQDRGGVDAPSEAHDGGRQIDGKIGLPARTLVVDAEDERR